MGTLVERRGCSLAAASTARAAALLVLPLLVLLLLSPAGLAGFGSPSPGVVSDGTTATSTGSGRVGAAPSSSSLPSAPPEPGWPMPRGGVGENGSTAGYAPEVDPMTGAPPLLAQTSLGRWAGNATGLSVAPGGPVLLTLGNDTIVAVNATDLQAEWWHNVSQPLVAGPSVAGGSVYAATSAGKVYAWLLNGSPEWNYSVDDRSAGAAPVPWHGDLYVLTEDLLTVLNGTTGSFLLQSSSQASDPAHTLAAGGQDLFAQAGNGSAFLNEFSQFGQLAHAVRDSVSTPGPTVDSDGYVAVAGTSGLLNAGIQGQSGWYTQLPDDLSTPIEPLAAGNGSLYATDGRGPLFSYAEANKILQWSTSPAWVTSAPSLAGSEVFAGVNSSVEAFDAGTGSALWQVPTPGPVVAPLAISDGVLYAVDASGNLTALGEPPLTAQVLASRTVTGSEITFTAVPAGGSGTYPEFFWAFSDGTEVQTAVPVATHTFPQAGPAWASVVVEDSENELSTVGTVPLTILTPLTVRLLADDPVTGGAPLWVNFTALPSGGAGAPWAGISLQVTGAQPRWEDLTGYSGGLVFSLPGADQVTAWVNDTDGDQAVSSSLPVVVSPASPAPPTVVAVPLVPGTVEAVWSATPVPGFQNWSVWASEDHAPSVLLAILPDASTDSYLLTGVPMGTNLSIQVGESTSYGPTVFSRAANLTTALVAPSLGVAADPAFPGDAALSWSLPEGATYDHFSHWSLLESFPGASMPLTVALPSYVGASNISYTTPPLPNGDTVGLALQADLSNGLNATSSTVAFTPLWSFPDVQVSASHLQVSVAWSLLDLPDFSSVVVCYATGDAGPWTCPITVPSPTSPVSGATLWLPSAGTYVVNATAFANNGFSVSAAPILITVSAAPAAPAWYATVFEGLALWLWTLLVLLLLGVVVLGYLVHRERTTIPPYLGEVLPWDPLAPELSPHAKPTSPETLETTPRLHRHRESHPHRHLRRHGAAVEEGTASGSEEAAGSEPKLKAPVRRTPVKVAPAAAEDEGDEEETAPAKPPSRPAKPPTPPSRSGGKIDQVGDEGEEQGDDEDGPSGKLAKMPVVLRHREGTDEGDAPSLLRSPPSSKRSAPSEGGKGPDDGDDDPASGEDATPPPRKPAPRPKPPADEEPTL